VSIRGSSPVIVSTVYVLFRSHFPAVNSESFSVLRASDHDPASHPLPRLRIFVSSPGDVDTERQIAGRVIERVRVRFQEYGQIEPYFWEYEPMRHHATFQNQIPPTSDFDVVICILWSRLGTPLIGPDGKRYASGTEYEVVSARESWQATGSPDVMIYLHDAPAQIRQFPDSEFQKMVDQLKALKRFVAEHCQDPVTGEIKGAFTTYRDLGQFETLLEKHLEKLIEQKLPKRWIAQRLQIAPHWVGESPFRGLAAFDFEHAPIFFGRTKAVGDVLTQLRRRMAEVEDGRAARMREMTVAAFVLISAMSGVGKSSLVRAGILPLLVEPGNGIALWRRASVRPSESAGDLFDCFAHALCAEEALPELVTGETTVERVADFLRRNPAGIEFGLSSALDRASAELRRQEELDLQAQEQSLRHRGRVPDADAVNQKIAELRKTTFPSRLVIVVDQLEELFTLESVTTEVRTHFITAIAALTRSGRVAALGTLRSDFFEKCAEVPVLAELSRGDGLYHLVPPNALEIGQMIREPAIAAGLQFEVHPETKQSLDERLRDAATRNPEALPLLQFCLEALYQAQAKRGDGLLTHADYDAMGGVEGALANRAEETFRRLQPAEQAEFDRVMRAVTTADDHETFTRRWADRDELIRVPAAKAFVEAFLAPEARLLVVDRDLSGRVVLSVTHEALLTRWERLHQWLLTNLENLRMRAQVSVDALRWRQSGRNDDYLYASALPLAKAQDLAERDFLDDAEREFVAASVRMARSASEKKRRNLHRVIAGVSTVAVVAFALAITSFVQYSRAKAARRQASQAAQRAKLARSEAEKLINFLVGDLHDKLKPIGKLDLLAEISNRVRAYYENFAEREKNPEALKQWSAALINQGDVLTDKGDLSGALNCYRDSLRIREGLTKQNPGNADLQNDLAVVYARVGDAQKDQGDLTAAVSSYRSSLGIERALIERERINPEWKHQLAFVLRRLSYADYEEGNHYGAMNDLQESVSLGRSLIEQVSNNSIWQIELADSLQRLGDVQSDQNDSWGALQSFQDCLAIREKLIERNPDNLDYQMDLSIALERLGDSLIDQGSLIAALGKYRAALVIRQKLVERDSANVGWRRQLSFSLEDVGNTLFAQRNLTEALRNFKDCLSIREGLAEADADNASAQRDVWICEQEIAQVLVSQKDFDQAITRFARALGIVRRLIEKNPNNYNWKRDLAIILQRIGEAKRAQGTLREAEMDLRDSLTIFTALTRQDQENQLWRYDLSGIESDLGQTLADKGDTKEASEHYYASVKILNGLSEKDSASLVVKRDLAIDCVGVGAVLESEHRLVEAIEKYRSAYSILGTLIDKQPENADWLSRFANVSYRLGKILSAGNGDPAEARTILVRSQDALLRLQSRNALSAEEENDLRAIQAGLGTPPS
jgi:tetratricopeptide (TPR) repeat protein